MKRLFHFIVFQVLLSSFQVTDAGIQLFAQAGKTSESPATASIVKQKTIDQIKNEFRDVRIPVIEGDFQLVYDADPDQMNKWGINDHCLIRDEKGRIHFFGIENPFLTTTEVLKSESMNDIKNLLVPSDKPFILTTRGFTGHLYRAGTHFRIGHAVADNIRGPWEKLPAALGGDRNKDHHGSPYVVYSGNKYWMFEPTDGSGIFTSTDLTDWSPVADATPWSDKTVFGPGHRDPCIIKLGDGTFLQYFAGNTRDSLSSIMLASSEDLKTWNPEKPCYSEKIPKAASWGIFESPYVLRHGGLYYLFVCYAHRHYYETIVVVSDNPRSFSSENKLTTLYTHAPEFIEIDGETYMSSCGIEDPQVMNHFGLWICKIKWLAP